MTINTISRFEWQHSVVNVIYNYEIMSFNNMRKLYSENQNNIDQHFLKIVLFRNFN